MGDEANKEENRFRSVMEELRGMRKKMEKMEEDKQATEKKLRELEALRQTITREGKRKEREEDTEERREERKDTPKKRRIELPKINTNNIVVANVKRFIEKAKEKIKGEEEAEEIDVAISNALQNSTYDLYSEAKKEMKGDLTKKNLKLILDKVLTRIEREKVLVATIWDLEKEGQKENETMYL